MVMLYHCDGQCCVCTAPRVCVVICHMYDSTCIQICTCTLYALCTRIWRAHKLNPQKANGPHDVDSMKTDKANSLAVFHTDSRRRRH